MPTDTYTKIILTVIAFALVALCALQLSGPVGAQIMAPGSSQFSPLYVSLKDSCGSIRNPCYISNQ